VTYRDAILIVVDHSPIAREHLDRLALLLSSLADLDLAALLDALVVSRLWLDLWLGSDNRGRLRHDRDELDAAWGLVVTEKILEFQIWTQTQYYDTPKDLNSEQNLF
jgi:hypothetical protein